MGGGRGRLDVAARQRRIMLLRAVHPSRGGLRRCGAPEPGEEAPHLFRSARSLVATSSSMYAKMNDLRAPSSWVNSAGGGLSTAGGG
jgi:hypothetical protein